MERKLSINIIPASAFGQNLRSEIPEQWDELRRECYRKANYRCEVCGGVGYNHPVECHEIWEFKNGIQRLIRLIALCPKCHQCQHPGLARIRGHYSECVAHYARVNGVSEEQAEQDYASAFREWHQRSQQTWVLDISAIKPVTPLPTPYGAKARLKKKGGDMK